MTPVFGPPVVNESHADGAAPIEMTANDFIDEGTDPIVLAERAARDGRAGGSLFGAHPGSVRVRDGVDLIAPVLEDVPEAETGEETDPQRIITD